ncbi:MAG: C10 family peptidase [Bacteroidales bacterium]|nr:C10 family peptidase [Bacteroidales bacterium]
MRYILTFLFLLLIQAGMFAQNISRNEALQIGGKFYTRKASAFSIEKSTTIICKEALIKSPSGNESIYVFNYSSGGFVLVSADQRAVPVLAYSLDSEFDTQNLAPATQLWIDKYLEQYDLIVENNVSTNDKLMQMWDEVRTGNLKDIKSVKGVDKLITTRWNQNYPYNYYCPTHSQGPGGRVYAGCVATTMAQIMKFWNYPEIGRGSARIFWGGYVEVDFANVEYKWEEMSTSINSMSRDAIAELIFHCGVSVGMDYGYEGSGASIENSFFALKQNFRYRAGMSHKNKYMYEDYEWKFLLKEDLDKGHPILYRGTDDGGNGHAFVCDGYQDTSYFHFNWGWGGSADGFFYLDNINPQMSFQWGQGALLNIMPIDAAYCNSMVYNQIQWTFDDGSGPNYYFNNQNCDWLISLTDHNVEFVKINFLRFNTLENDILYIYEGNSDAGTLIGEYSANDIPTELIVYNDEVYFKFISNSEGQAEGWELMYETSVLGVENNIMSDISIYPNPAKNQLNIVGLVDNSNITIYDLSGKVMKEISANNRVSCNISDLSSGIYFVKIQNDQESQVVKFVKE